MIDAHLHRFRRSGIIGVLLASVLAPANGGTPHVNFVQHESPRPVAAIDFEDGEGRRLSLADFRGKVVLLNIWATWCGPCRREMPALDRLEARLGGPDFEVVALSIDRSGKSVIQKFYSDHGIRSLAIYNDSTGKASRELGAVGVPATLLLDREGRELGRVVGPADWDEPPAVEYLKHVIVGNSADEGERNP